MANEEDECDSSSLFAVASQSDVTSFLHAQAAKITGLNSSISDDDDDDDESSIDGSLLSRFAQVTTKNSTKLKKPYLSHSCFASISSSSSSSQKQNTLDDLTELKWLNTFKLKEFKDDNNNNEDRISKLSNELKSYDNNNNINTSFDVLIFLALYSKHDDKQIPWSLTIKQIYEYIQINFKQIINKRGWKNLLKQTLITNPCFIKTKRDILKSRSIWTIDPYYRPLLTKVYLTSLSLQSNKKISTNENNEKQLCLDANRSSESIVNNFAPKATVKTKVLPRLYERLCEEKINNEDGDEADSNNIIKRQRNPISGRKRPRSASSSGYHQSIKNNDEKRLSSSSPWIKKLNKRHKIQNHPDMELKTSTPNKGSNIITPCPSIDHMYLNRKEKQKKSTESIEYNESSIDEYDNSPNRKSIITTRSKTSTRNIKTHLIHRRKSSPPKKRLSLILPSHRPNTRISKKIIEHDLELLRQANIDQQPLDLSIISSNQLLSFKKSTTISNEDVLDLSLSR